MTNSAPTYNISYNYAIEGIVFIFHSIALVPPPLLQMYPGQSDKAEKALLPCNGFVFV